MHGRVPFQARAERHDLGGLPASGVCAAALCVRRATAGTPGVRDAFCGWPQPDQALRGEAGVVTPVEMLVDQLGWLGGIAARDQLAVSKRVLDTALALGIVRRVRRGCYALPAIAEARGRAAAWDGVLSHTSAAVAHGWPVARAPELPHVMLPRDRHVRRRPADVICHTGRLLTGERRTGVTEPVRTVTDCARILPFGEALAVADSALRSGVDPEELAHAAERIRGPGAARVRRVVGAASALAANPFESGLRAICLDIPLLDVQPQVHIAAPALAVRVDLADCRLGLVLEADGYEFHGRPEGFARDRRRYTALAQLDWVVFAYVWDDIFLAPEHTRAALASWAERHTQLFPGGRPGAWRSSWRPASALVA